MGWEGRESNPALNQMNTIERSKQADRNAQEFLTNLPIFHTFVTRSKKTGKEFEFTAIGKTREAAREHLLAYSLKNLNWNRWELLEAK
jgi:hypothetical protein